MRSRTRRLLGHSIRLALFALLCVWAVRYFVAAVGVGGWTPRATFAFLLLTGAASLVWRAALDVRNAYRRRA